VQIWGDGFVAAEARGGHLVGSKQPTSNKIAAKQVRQIWTFIPVPFLKAITKGQSPQDGLNFLLLLPLFFHCPKPRIDKQ
jgi:hypothetical protein